MDFVLKQINLGLRRFYYGNASIINIKSVSRFLSLEEGKKSWVFLYHFLYLREHFIFINALQVEFLRLYLVMPLRERLFMKLFWNAVISVVLYAQATLGFTFFVELRGTVA